MGKEPAATGPGGRHLNERLRTGSLHSLPVAGRFGSRPLLFVESPPLGASLLLAQIKKYAATDGLAKQGQSRIER